MISLFTCCTLRWRSGVYLSSCSRSRRLKINLLWEMISHRHLRLNFIESIICILVNTFAASSWCVRWIPITTTKHATLRFLVSEGLTFWSSTFHHFEVHVLTSLWPHVLWMHKKFWVLVSDALIFFGAYQVWVFLSFLILWDELCSHMRWPEVCWGRHGATKSLLELSRVEHLDKCCRSTIWSKHYLSLRFLVDKWRDAFV